MPDDRLKKRYSGDIMAKTAGGIRNSKWHGDIYTVDGVRKEYYELNEERKMVVRSMSKDIAKEMWRNLKDKTVTLGADGSKITVGFTKSGVDHVARDAMLTLSGKYMSPKTMRHVDRLLAKSEYVPTSHEDKKGRNDGKMLFYRYKDKEGRGIYFKVTYEPRNGGRKYYSLYSVSDRME